MFVLPLFLFTLLRQYGVEAQHVRCAADNFLTDAIKGILTGVANGPAKAPAMLAPINTYIHIITTADQQQQDYSDAMIAAQMTALNKSYLNESISFVFRGTSRTTNSAWATAGPQTYEEQQMKTALRQGTYKDLNLYMQSNLGGGLLGVCYFPVRAPSDLQRTLDGCQVLASSMPGGTAAPYDLGLTAVHEVGHWFGLYHVFQTALPIQVPLINLCLNSDEVVDTPIQANATTGCPAIKDTCPLFPGVDNIHNYMDYSDDVCLTEFTPGQGKRMRLMYDQLRANK